MFVVGKQDMPGSIMYDGERHIIHETPFGKFLRDHLNDPWLFTYKHARSGNWVVAAWVDRPGGRMQELLIMGKAPVGSRDMVRKIEEMKVGNPEHEARRVQNFRALRGLKKNWARKEEAIDKQAQDSWDYLVERSRTKQRTRHTVVPR